MPAGDLLTPQEAATIANNVYFTLKDWSIGKPLSGAPESADVVRSKLLGAPPTGTAGPSSGSLHGSQLGSAQLGKIYSAKTGLGVSSGFGYTLSFSKDSRKHVVVATRGTRPEMQGKPDLLTDLRAGMTPFGDIGPVHNGFKKTYDSILPALSDDHTLFDKADVIHCVGHSLGGAVATLIAARFAKLGRPVRLYTFGSPRVGCFGTYAALERSIGPKNIFRVAHDLDPITLIAPYPYIHVQPSPAMPGNLTQLSPTGHLISTANHDINAYIRTLGRLDWSGLSLAATAVDHDNALLVRWLLHDTENVSFIRYATVETLSLLFKLFEARLKKCSVSLVLHLTALDLLCEIIARGVAFAKALGDAVLHLLRCAALWAGVQIKSAAEMTVDIVRAILEKMLSAIRTLAFNALSTAGKMLTPMPLIMAGGVLLQSASAF